MSDITDSREELDKAVYEANKPIYDPVDDCCDDDDCDYDCDDEELDRLNEDLDDDDSDWEEVVQSDDSNMRLAVRNYIENKHELGVNPTLKNIADIKVSRDNGLLCKNLAVICDELGFNVERNLDKILSDLEVRPHPFN